MVNKRLRCQKGEYVTFKKKRNNNNNNNNNNKVAMHDLSLKVY